MHAIFTWLNLFLCLYPVHQRSATFICVEGDAGHHLVMPPPDVVDVVPLAELVSVRILPSELDRFPFVNDPVVNCLLKCCGTVLNLSCKGSMSK